MWPAAAQAVDAQTTFTTLYSFDFVNYGNGAGPVGSLAIDGNGVLYGATQVGGAYTGCPGGENSGCGAIYSLTPPASSGGAWSEEVLWSCGGNPTDAYNPSGVTMGSGGVLFGVASGGEFGYGAVFSLTPPANPGGAWAEAVLYRFAGPPDGELPPFPSSSLAIDGSGVLYGTTYFGGTSANCSRSGCGTVFSMTPPASPGGVWAETVLWSFGGERDGIHPIPELAIASDGTLYGATQLGGSHSTGGNENKGIAFSLTPSSGPDAAWAESVLHNFPYSGKQSPVGLTLGAGGELYGTTALQEKDEQGGTVFSLTPPSPQGGAWTMTRLHTFPARSFEADVSDQPEGPLVPAGKTDAAFGATGDNHGAGTIFEMVPPKPGGSAWAERVLDNTHTVLPSLGLRSGGVLYGTNSVADTVWSLVP